MRLRIVPKFLFCTPIKPPPNPIGGMGLKLSKQEMDKLMNPLGFLQDGERKEVEEQINKAKELKELIDKFKQNKEQKKEIHYDKNGMPIEVGFKVNGPEPTRYGDWIGRGRLTDF